MEVNIDTELDVTNVTRLQITDCTQLTVNEVDLFVGVNEGISRKVQSRVTIKIHIRKFKFSIVIIQYYL